MIIFCTILFSYIFITFQFTDETVMSNSNSKGQYGQAEVLAHIVRANRRMKAIRRSQAYQEVKKMNADPITEEGSISSETKEANFEKRKSNFNRLKQKSEDEINKEEKYVFYFITFWVQYDDVFMESPLYYTYLIYPKIFYIA